MNIPDEYLSRMQSWAEDYDPSSVEPLDRALVHKHEAANVFVGKVERLCEGAKAFYLTELTLPIDHAFFFEHPKDHIPGLMLLEAGRQAGTALAHLYHGVPMDREFILEGLEVKFHRFVNNSDPVYTISSVGDCVEKKGELRQMYHEGTYFQNGEAVAYMGGGWHMVSKRLLKRTGWSA